MHYSEATTSNFIFPFNNGDPAAIHLLRSRYTRSLQSFVREILNNDEIALKITESTLSSCIEQHTYLKSREGIEQFLFYNAILACQEYCLNFLPSHILSLLEKFKKQILTNPSNFAYKLSTKSIEIPNFAMAFKDGNPLVIAMVYHRYPKLVEIANGKIQNREEAYRICDNVFHECLVKKSTFFSRHEIENFLETKVDFHCRQFKQKNNSSIGHIKVPSPNLTGQSTNMILSMDKFILASDPRNIREFVQPILHTVKPIGLIIPTPRKIETEIIFRHYELTTWNTPFEDWTLSIYQAFGSDFIGISLVEAYALLDDAWLWYRKYLSWKSKYWSYKAKRYLDKDYCCYCGCYIKFYSKPTIEHLVPLSRGGNDLIENKKPCCWFCNQERADRSLPSWLESMILSLPHLVEEDRNKLENKIENVKHWIEYIQAEGEKLYRSETDYNCFKNIDYY